MRPNGLEIIRAFFPFSFREKVDPRKIFSVGEQVMAEHLFSFHAKASTRGFVGVRSRLEFDESIASVRITPSLPIFRGDGSELDFESVCSSVKSSLAGTRHAPYASILKGVKCDERAGVITAFFDRLPVNIRYLFTLPDFSLFDADSLPLSSENSGRGTGPYLLEDATQSLVKLKINPNYPKNLTSNRVKKVELVNYKPAETKQFIKDMDPSVEHVAYFYGYAIDEEDLSTLKSKRYVIDMFPTEWFVYVLVKKHVDAKLRWALAQAIDQFREFNLSKNGLGLPAFSISPSDRDFSLSKAEYENFSPPHDVNFDRTMPITVYTSSSWSKIPFYEGVIECLRKSFPNLVLKELAPSDSGKLFSSATDVSLALLGISPSDPLSHFSFLESTLDGFSDVATKKEISGLAVLTNQAEFNQRVKAIEMKVRKMGLILPIAHFPGVVAHRHDIARDDNISFGWGIQAWSFRVD